MDTALLAFPVGLLIGEFVTVLVAYLIADTASGTRSRISMATTFSDITVFVAASLLFEGVVRKEGWISSISPAWIFPAIAGSYAIAGVGIYFGRVIERQVGEPPGPNPTRTESTHFFRREIQGLRRAMALVAGATAYLFGARIGAGLVRLG